MTTRWQDIAPGDAVGINLAVRTDITAPLNEDGVRCPWPWEPQQLGGVPLGQYHCEYCGAMVVAGMEHLDYAEEQPPLDPEESVYVCPFCGARSQHPDDFRNEYCGRCHRFGSAVDDRI